MIQSQKPAVKSQCQGRSLTDLFGGCLSTKIVVTCYECKTAEYFVPQAEWTADSQTRGVPLTSGTQPRRVMPATDCESVRCLW